MTTPILTIVNFSENCYMHYLQNESFLKMLVMLVHYYVQINVTLNIYVGIGLGHQNINPLSIF